MARKRWEPRRLLTTAGESNHHRRRIDTENKANSRHFCLGGKIVCRNVNLCSGMCSIVYTAVVLFLLLLWGGGDALCVDLYFKFKDIFNYFIYYFIC